MCVVGAAGGYPVCPDGSNIDNIINYQELVRVAQYNPFQGT